MSRGDDLVFPGMDSHGKAQSGITIRELFAATAMQGLLCRDAELNWSSEQVALMAVEQADELLAELDKLRPND